MKRVFLFFFIVLLLIIGSLFLVRSAFEQEVNHEGRIKVVASFYPLAHFSEQILGELGEISTLTPPGSDAHSFSPTPRDAVSIHEADIFFYNGAGFDEHIEEFALSLQTNGLHVVDMSQFIDLLKVGSQEEENASSMDPHYWQSPKSAQIMVREMSAILKEFAKTDEQKGIITQNTVSYLDELAVLDTTYQNGLAECRLADTVVAHDAFRYTAKDYEFNIIPIAGLSPQDKPSAKRLGEIAELAAEKGIGHIFFETLSSPELSETLAREVGAQTLVLNPLEGLTVGEIKAGGTYVSVMEQNLLNLKQALSCK